MLPLSNNYLYFYRTKSKIEWYMVVARATSSNYSAYEDNIGEKKTAIHVSISIHRILP